ncbi:hypothetical protein K7X08_015834 [Anisodus acutangulus]|uniref:WD repeat-containing protein 44 n=1 Tax=Anisodus acutangulus TaxID=402998 RepID=A0A9Q1LEW6_9SOLA|nr:hypothetical protein K7X08_015834 [Anisodus acutangulus]
MDRKTLTMNWDGLGEEDDDDNFFESRDRLSTAIPLDLGSSGSDNDDDFEDSRLSFVSTLSSASIKKFQGIEIEAVSEDSFSSADYGMWMAEPGDIKERRKRLLQGMGLSSNKDLLKLKSAKIVRAISRKVDKRQDSKPPKADSSPAKGLNQKQQPVALVRSRSDGDIQYFSVNTKKRKEELIGDISKQRLTRTFSGVLAPSIGTCQLTGSVRMSPRKNRSGSLMQNGGDMSSTLSNGSPDVGFASFFLIKNLDTGKEFIVKESNEHGMWNKLSDIQTGKQLTMDEFEKHVGYSPVVKELMRRVNGSRNHDDERKLSPNSYLSKRFRNSKRRGVALLKNIKGVAHSMSGKIIDKEREQPVPEEQQKPNKNSSKWTKVRQHGKTCKEFTALHLCQEIHAHEGSIWTIRFSSDAHYLATAGEDTLIHIWEVQECEVTNDLAGAASASPIHPTASSFSASPIHPTASSLSASPVHPIARSNSDRPPLPESGHMTSERRKKGKVSHKKKGNSVPEYVKVPETVFSLSEKPICTLKGHQEDVLDLSWSRSQLLLSSSIDKTVRLWNVETQTCLKMFAHNDYVTCIQINPMDDDYFISGSLDAKVRIWNIPDRKVVDWTDLHEMVTATCFTPDGQGALIGSHKGSCRMYTTSECKLEQKDNIEIQPKKNSQLKKVTGLQFAPRNPAEVLITSADSRIRIFDGSEMIYKFRGFRNTSSQIAASFSSDGKYIISASEDSHVYIWKREEPKSPSGKPRTSISVQAHERFQCKDVSVAIPWPGSVKNEAPLVEMHSKRHSKRFLPPQYPTVGSPTKENSDLANSKRHLPPLNVARNKSNALERVQSSREEEDLAQLSRTDSGTGPSESFASGSSSTRFGDSPSISASSSSRSQSWSSSWSQDGSNSHGSNVIQATAWGMVIVTATLGGEIKVYQNFGLPLKAGRQTNLFRDLT